jgi:uncharacterized protein (DUF1501 family)
MTMTRRDFMRQGARWARGGRPAAVRVGERPRAIGRYQALVCIFLFGGNDGNNAIIPIDNYAR